MNKLDISALIVCIALATLAGFAVSLVYDYNINYLPKSKMLQIETEESFNLPIIDGNIESPSVIITVETYEEFLETIKTLKPEVVYRFRYVGTFKLSIYYYAFNEDMTIAYKYRLVTAGRIPFTEVRRRS